jgi:hypothetical protein
MTRDEQTRADAEAQFRRTLIQVLIVQIVALAILGFLQIRYTI